ncbi:neuropeptide Y receptor type 6-like [Ostrea edulis]|uniref:neuropeptide Y receptor type 6-like n=1 Tax=Ostrea edulis TaxID=37623 RepID=UPI0024AEA601|nr:neuropeptide Y receptor type 6-like [Ostrea edulis]
MANSSDNGSEYGASLDNYWTDEGNFPSSFVFPCSPDFPYLCPVAIIAIVISTLGIIGNIAVIASMVKEKLYRKTSHMSILVLAVIDVLCLFVIITRECIYFPNEFYFVEKFGFSNTFCITFFVFNNTPYLSSCWNVVFLAYERYVLVTNPLVYINNHTPKVVVIRALVAFILVIVVNVAYALITVVMTGISKCPDFVLMPLHYGFVTLPMISASLFSLIFFHCSKVSKLRNSTRFKGRHTRNEQQFPHMTTIVYVIVIIFIVSQIPYLMFDVISIFEHFELITWPYEYLDILLHVSIIVFLINYASNPFIYWITPLRIRCRRKTPKSSTEITNASITVRL